jgi:hypothetical protein
VARLKKSRPGVHINAVGDGTPRNPKCAAGCPGDALTSIEDRGELVDGQVASGRVWRFGAGIGLCPHNALETTPRLMCLEEEERGEGHRSSREELTEVGVRDAVNACQQVVFLRHRWSFLLQLMLFTSGPAVELGHKQAALIR